MRRKTFNSFITGVTDFGESLIIETTEIQFFIGKYLKKKYA